MRALKIAMLLTLIALGLFGAALAWMVRSEQGSRWLLEQGLAFAPVMIEADGIAGTLAEGLAIESLRIPMPMADLRAREITVSWSPAALLAGMVQIDAATVTELSIDVLESEGDNEEPPDRLFWLQIPVAITIESGQIDRLRIDAADFENLRFIGGLGHGRLEVEKLLARIAGADVRISGELTGPAPGHLEATASWELPAANLTGTANIAGDIDELAVTHVLQMPDEVRFQGSIYDLLSGPTLSGVAEWSAVRLPGATVLHSNAGKFALSSDFRTARLEGISTLLLEGWPEAPLQLNVLADLQGLSIDAYLLEVLGGRVTGSGRIDYSDGLQGQLIANAAQIDTSLINDRISGPLEFDATLMLESADAFDIDVTAARALIAGKAITGKGLAQWRDGVLSALNAAVVAGTNNLSADVKLGPQLAGTIKADLPDLALLWPGLEGSLEADMELGGSLAKPQLRISAKAASLAYESQALDTLAVTGVVQANGELKGQLTATGLVTGRQPLGDLNISLTGALAAHQARLNLAGDLVAVEIRTSGGWDGARLTQRFDYGRVQPDGFDGWELEQAPELNLSADGGNVDPHCWRQSTAGICIESANWDANNLQLAAIVDGFELAALNPLLAEGYSIDGTVNADLKVLRNSAGLRGELHWRQSRTLLAYADEIDEFRTELDQVRVDLVSTDERTDFATSVSGEAGLTLSASAAVDGPLADDSPLVAAANGSLPSVGLLRPLVRRVVRPGDLRGELTIDLDVGGTLGSPVFTGGAYLADGVLGLPDAGITLTDISIAATSNATDRLQLAGQLRSGDGVAELRGDIHSKTDAEGNADLVADIRITGDNLASLRTPDISVDTSPDLRLYIGEGVFDITGAIEIPRARAKVRDLPKNAVTRSEDVIVHAPERAQSATSDTILTGDIEVLLGDDVRFDGFGLTSRLEGSLRLTQSRGGFLRSGGTVRVREGFLTGYGKELRVDRGDLTFTGPLDDPLVNIQVSRESFYEGKQYTVGLRLTGSARNVKTEPFSRPAMSDNDVLAFLLIDRPAGDGADASGAAVAMGLGQLFGGDGGLMGLDEVGFETNDANQATMVAGKRISDRIYVRYLFGSSGEPGAFRMRYRLGKGFSLEANTGSTQSLDLIYLLER